MTAQVARKEMIWRNCRNLYIGDLKYGIYIFNNDIATYH